MLDILLTVKFKEVEYCIYYCCWFSVFRNDIVTLKSKFCFIQLCLQTVKYHYIVFPQKQPKHDMLHTVSKIQNAQLQQLCNISPTYCALSQLCDDLQLRSGYGIEGRIKDFTIQTFDTWISFLVKSISPLVVLQLILGRAEDRPSEK